MEFKTIKDLLAAVKDGRVDENELHIVLDNDCTMFFDGPPSDEEENGIEVDECNGYMDVEPLYKLLFPKATVEWC